MNSSTHAGASSLSVCLIFDVVGRLVGVKARAATAKRHGLRTGGTSCYPSGQVVGEAYPATPANRTITTIIPLSGACPSGEDMHFACALTDGERAEGDSSALSSTGRSRP